MKAKLFFLTLTASLLCSLACSRQVNGGSEPGTGTGKDNCICTMEYDPVCGENGKTYSNPCLAECDGVKKYTKGECK